MFAKAAQTIFFTPALAMMAVAPKPAGGVEQASYDVLEKADGIEIRRYPQTIVAQTIVTASDRQSAARKGFMSLAGYIFGQNESGDKIAMTAPVTTSPVTPEATTTQKTVDGKYTVQFVMPSKWTMETLPIPANPHVTLKALPLRYVVATGMVGRRTLEQIAAMEAKISAFVSKRKLMTTGGFISAGYDGPSKAEEKRRWEVMQEVTALQ